MVAGVRVVSGFKVDCWRRRKDDWPEMISITENAGGTDLVEEVRGVFSRTGLLSASKDFEYRVEQEDLACAVAESFLTAHPLVAEAGTGVGKSLAYLVPAAKFALRTGRKAVISTHTINLQEQLVRKDIPLVRNVLGEELPAVLLKGRGNYLCPSRLRRAWEQAGDLFTSSESEELARIRAWADETRDGTLSGMPFSPSPKVWSQVCSEAHSCTQRYCGPKGDCWFQEARKAAADAKLVVVNHTLFFALLNTGEMATEAGTETMPGFLFPNDFAVMDEAHTLEQVAAVQLGLRISQAGLRFDLQRLYNPKTRKGILKAYRKAAPMMAVERGLVAVEKFFGDIGEAAKFGEWSKEFRVRKPELVGNQLAGPLRELSEELVNLAEDTDQESSKNELMDLARKLRETQAEVAQFLDQRDEGCVYWVEKSGREDTQFSCHAAPVNVADRLRPLLFSGKKCMVMTSATLGVGDPELGYFRKRVGAETARALSIGSPFDYRKQMKVRIFKSIPDPNTPAYDELLAKGIMDAVSESEGRAFVLFTSYRAMLDAAKRCEGYFKKRGWSLLKQGDGMARHRMLEEFRADVSSVLFGTDSFWTGVDVPGEALSNVVVTRLPFAVPDHPLTESRLESIQEQGGNSFMDYSVPEAILKLRQGVGRLIRTKKDRGLVCILDNRIVTKRYGKLFMNALPDAPVEIVS